MDEVFLMKPGNQIFKNARKPCKLRKDRGVIGKIDAASAYQEFCKRLLRVPL